ncbi:hypothetical protein GCM10022234_09120 [Aeromicrobium panaciterrae]|uniref:TetR/AcrR family transcriptional regulator n=1 Tax=Aeromicrobium panaciterrae TaxID=363861 RepID=UPI0031E24940
MTGRPPSEGFEVADVEDRLRRSVESIGTGERRMKRSQVLGPQAEQTRRNLAESARRLFQEKGYTGTTVAEIAQNANVSLATFYQYFKEIHDVTALIVVDFIKASLASQLDRWDSLGGVPALRDFIDRFLGLYVRNAELLELWETGKLVSPRLRLLYVDYYRVYRARLEECVRLGVDAGTVRDDLDPADLADLMATLVERYSYEHFVLLGEREVGNGVEILTIAVTSLVGLTEPVVDNTNGGPST